jgi:hypothetical protein
VLHHERTVRVVTEKEANVPRMLVNHSPRNEVALHLLFCFVRQIVIRADHLVSIQMQNSTLDEWWCKLVDGEPKGVEWLLCRVVTALQTVFSANSIDVT